VFIIIVLKLNLRVNFGQNPSHEVGESTRVNLGQCKDKNIFNRGDRDRDVKIKLLSR
jgi:hypothetical protein